MTPVCVGDNSQVLLLVDRLLNVAVYMLPLMFKELNLCLSIIARIREMESVRMVEA